MSNSYLSRRTLSSFSKLSTHSTLSDIDTAFRDEGFQPKEAKEFGAFGQRRSLTESYIASVDLNDPIVVRKLIRAVESIIRPLVPTDTGSCLAEWSFFVDYMAEDGWTISSEGRINRTVSAPEALLQSMTEISDVSAVKEGITRLQTLTDDPAASIGAAKELVESTAKILLRELEIEVKHNPRFPDLIKEVQLQLGLNPGGVGEVDSAPSIKRILSGVNSVVIGLNELRNAGFGTGHGQETARRGLSTRHATLAINAAVLWCQLVLSTFEDPAAPWRTVRHSS